MSRKGSVLDLAEQDGSEAGSTCSSLTQLAYDNGETEVTESDAFAQLLDDAFEKRGSTREAGLAGLINLMRTTFKLEDAQKNEATLMGRCCHSLRKGSQTEAALAATLAGLHVLTLGGQDEALYGQLQPELARAIQDGGSAPATRVAAIDALALACFVASEEEDSASNLLRGLASIWRRASGGGDARVRAAATRAWSFVLTSTSPRVIGAAEIEGLLANLAGMLQSTDVELRSAAGEAVALIMSKYDMQSLLGQEGDDEDEEGDEETQEQEERAGSGGSSASSSHAADAAGAPLPDGRSTEQPSCASSLEDVVDRMRELAAHGRAGAEVGGGVRRGARRHRAALRAAFRGLCATLDDGSAPQVKIKLRHGDTLVVESLTDVIRINFFRRVLATGFQPHLQFNPLLHEVFGFTPAAEPAARLSALEKRLFRSPNSASSRAQAQDRRAARSGKGGW